MTDSELVRQLASCWPGIISSQEAAQLRRIAEELEPGRWGDAPDGPGLWEMKWEDGEKMFISVHESGWFDVFGRAECFEVSDFPNAKFRKAIVR